MTTTINVYRGRDGVMDYATPVATMTEADTEVEIPNQDLPPGSTWHYRRRREADCCGLESEPSEPCIVRIDAAGEMRPATPNVPGAVSVEAQAGGTLRLRWRYGARGEEIAPTGFRVYVDSGSGFNWASPAATVAYVGPGGYAWLSGALSDGQRYRLVVRAHATAGGETINTAAVSAIARSTGPAALATPVASVTEES